MDEVSVKLREIVAKYGEGIASEPEKLEALLRDCCPGHRREIRLLMSVCREGLPRDLRNVQVASDITLSRHFNILVDNYGFTPDLAYWAVMAWANALGIPTTFTLTPAKGTGKFLKTEKQEAPAAGEQRAGSPGSQSAGTASGQPAPTKTVTARGPPTPHSPVKSRKTTIYTLVGLIVAVILFYMIYSAVSFNPDGPGASQQPDSTTGGDTQIRTRSPGALRVGTDNRHPPFESENATSGGLEGFDVDLMNEIGRRLGLEVTYWGVPFDLITTRVTDGTCDCCISAIPITPERQSMVTFSDPYFESRQVILTRTGSPIKGPADLVEKMVGVQYDTPGYWAVMGITGINKYYIHAYDTTAEAFLALQHGNVEAVAGDAGFLGWYSQNWDGYTIAPGYLTEGEQFGIAISKDNPGLTKAINSALAEIRADGTLEALKKRWLIV